MIGWLVSRPRVRAWIIKQAMKTPGEDIIAGDGSGRIYMKRYWLFNPLVKNRVTGEWKRKYRMVPFHIRVHNILLPDADRHLHDHPFNARTWIMSGGYEELRAEQADHIFENYANPSVVGEVEIRDHYDNDYIGVLYARHPGSTTTLGHGQYHKITRLYDAQEGAWTVFAFGDWRGDWGFLVDGAKVLRAEYEQRFQKKGVQVEGE